MATSPELDSAVVSSKLEALLQEEEKKDGEDDTDIMKIWPERHMTEALLTRQDFAIVHDILRHHLFTRRNPFAASWMKKWALCGHVPLMVEMVGNAFRKTTGTVLGTKMIKLIMAVYLGTLLRIAQDTVAVRDVLGQPIDDFVLQSLRKKMWSWIQNIAEEYRPSIEDAIGFLEDFEFISRPGCLPPPFWIQHCTPSLTRHIGGTHIYFGTPSKESMASWEKEGVVAEVNSVRTQVVPHFIEAARGGWHAISTMPLSDMVGSDA